MARPHGSRHTNGPTLNPTIRTAHPTRIWYPASNPKLPRFRGPVDTDERAPGPDVRLTSRRPTIISARIDRTKGANRAAASANPWRGKPGLTAG